MELYQYPGQSTPITSVQIGAPGESCSDRYVTVTPVTPFSVVVFQHVGSDGSQFCLDDLTIIPIPEPSSLAPLAIAAARRKRR
jgi:hypothetical protein